MKSNNEHRLRSRRVSRGHRARATSHVREIVGQTFHSSRVRDDLWHEDPSTSGAGDTVVPRYRITREIGRGGMGVVYEAIHVMTGREVALKMPRPELCHEPTIVERFVREGRCCARLKSRFVTQVIDLVTSRTGAPVLVMDLLKGKSLALELRAREATQTYFSIDETVAIMIQACAGLARAHQLGVVHRDLKPGNLFLEDCGRAPRVVRVIDFGVSKMTHPADGDSLNESLTSPLDAIGTLTYMAPEQVRCGASVTAAADVWALGVIFYRMLMGRPPIDGTGIDVVEAVLSDSPMPALPPMGDLDPRFTGLEHVVARALEKDPTRRYGDARELGRALARYADPHAVLVQRALREMALNTPLESNAYPSQQSQSQSQSRSRASSPSTLSSHALSRHRRDRLLSEAILVALGVVIFFAATAAVCLAP